MRDTPFDRIKESLSLLLPSDALSDIPEKWEKIGTVVTLRVPESLLQYQETIGKVYAEVLGCTTVLRDVGGITGVYREPVTEVLYGSSQTETVHLENGIRYKLDPQRIMFSSGNLGERKRMATISGPGETVADMFAGIGYFTLPMAVYSTPKKIVACEMNPVAYKYLCTNIVLNHVTKIVEPLLGDNRVTAPKNCADRVILGYLDETRVFLPVALECLKNHIGVLHYHDVVPDEVIPDHPLKQIQAVANTYHRSATLLAVKNIKSYTPGVSHVVLDVKIGES
jgi:tRNA wybutosine-synthesizing protein 2